MGTRAFGAALAMLCMMTPLFVLADDVPTANSLDSSSNNNQTVVQLLMNVQVAVADDPALAHMFDIPNADQMSEEELTTLLQNLLNASVGSGLNASINNDTSSSLDSAEAMDSVPPTGPTVSTASRISLSVAMAVLATVAALGAAM